MRPTIIKINATPAGFTLSLEAGELIRLDRAKHDHRAVIKALVHLEAAVGRDPFYVLALVLPNDRGGHDFLPTFTRALRPSEEPDW